MLLSLEPKEQQSKEQQSKEQQSKEQQSKEQQSKEQQSKEHKPGGHQGVKIRAITAGAPLKMPLDAAELQRAGKLARAAREALTSSGWEVQTTRLATPPLSALVASAPEQSPAVAVDFARAVEAAAADEGFGYVSLGAVNTLAAPPGVWAPLLGAIPEIIQRTERIFCAATVATREDGINLAAARACGELIARVATQTDDGFGNLRFAALANCPPNIPFFPAAYHDGGHRPTLGIALEAADLAVAAFSAAQHLDDARARLVAALSSQVEHLTALVEEVDATGERAAACGVDLSLAPFPAEDRSIAYALERLGLPAFGMHGTLFLASFVTDCLAACRRRVWGSDTAREAPEAAPPSAPPAQRRFGFSGLMLPVLEDSTLAARASEGTFGVDSLLLYAAVCGLGLDTVPLPGDTSPGELSAIILDVAALAVRLDKPLTARLFPVPGKRAGDPVSWDFAFFAPSCVLPVRGLAPQGLLAHATYWRPDPPATTEQ